MNSVTCPACFHPTPVLGGSADAPPVCLRCRVPLPAHLLSPADGPPPEGGEAAPDVKVYAVEPYAGTPGGSPVGSLVTLAVGLVGAGVLGFAAAFLRQYFWFVLIFAALLGLAIGGVTGLGAWLARYRRKGGAAAAGAGAGLAGAVLLHYFGYLLLVPEPLRQFISFIDYLDLRCEDGAQPAGINLGYVGSAIYWGVEGLVVVVAAAAVATWPVDRPYCAGCNAWKEKKPLGAFRVDGPRAVQAVAAGQPGAMVTPAEANDRVVVGLYTCTKCGTAGGVEAEVAATRGEGDGAVTQTVRVSYPGEAAADFEAAKRECQRLGLDLGK